MSEPAIPLSPPPPKSCERCGSPLLPTETWFRVQKGKPPELLTLCTKCAMAKIPGRVSL